MWNRGCGGAEELRHTGTEMVDLTYVTPQVLPCMMVLPHVNTGSSTQKTALLTRLEPFCPVSILPWAGVEGFFFQRNMSKYSKIESSVFS